MVEVSVSGREVQHVDNSTHSLMHEHIYLNLHEVDRMYSRTATLGLSPLQIRTKLVARTVNRILSSIPITALIGLCTLYSLFADDIRMLAFSKDADDYFDSLFVTCMVIFVIEIAATSGVRKQYRWSFYFCLDVLSTVSLIPDISWFRTAAMNQGSATAKVAPVQSALRASRAGSRTARIIRVLRLFRILRLVKLYKATKHAMAHSSNTIAEVEIPKESRIGRRLTELTTKRVIVIIIILLIMLPLCDITIYLETSTTSWEYGLRLLAKSNGASAFLPVFQKYLQYHQDDYRPLVSLSFTDCCTSFLWKGDKALEDLRMSEVYIFTAAEVVAVFDGTADTQLEALLSIFRTLFVCVVFTLGALYLTKDSNEMVIVPIEKMMNKVRRLSANPLSPIEDPMQDVYDVEMQTFRCCNFCRLTNHRERETAVLEDSIMKIGALLALSFGEAGSAIISGNLEKAGRLNLLLDGNKVRAVFGFCDIRNFTDTTEVLQEDIMVFINEIAAIVHYTVDAHLGAPNKNVGDAFLLVWKSPDDSEIYTDEYLTNLADLSIISCLKILAYINTCPRLLKYRAHQGLLKRMRNYTVKIGFGVHFGWAIEGPMGSELKIDVSYLSPHVNIASQLQEATKRYGVPVLFSSMLFEILSNTMKQRCRHIDTISFKAAASFRLYTYDVETDMVQEPKQRVFTKEQSKHKRRNLFKCIDGGSFRACDILGTSKKISGLQSLLTPDFNAVFAQAVHAYEKGNWPDCGSLLESAMRIIPNDKPTAALYQFLAENGFRAPAAWRGYRELPEY